MEDLTIHLASISKINVVPHILIRLKTNNLAYITKSIDRTPKGKLQIEDICQITEKMIGDKYHGSHEQVARTILKFSVNPGLDIVNFFEQVLFSFQSGNAVILLRNFSLIRHQGTGYVLSATYDKIAMAIVNLLRSQFELFTKANNLINNSWLL